MEPEQVNVRVLQLFREHLTNVVSQDSLDKMESTAQFDVMTKRWTQVAAMFMLGVSCKETVHRVLFWHPTIWGHLRQSCHRVCPTFARWLRVAVHTEQTPVLTVIRLMCPHLPHSREDTHLEWMAQNGEAAARENVYINALRQIEVETNRMLDVYPVGALGRVTLERVRGHASRALGQTEGSHAV